MLLREYLQAKGFTTILCPDGEAGYKEFNKNKFDIAVLDVMMPKKDGFTLAQEIRQTNGQPANHLPYCQDFEGGYSWKVSRLVLMIISPSHSLWKSWCSV